MDFEISRREPESKIESFLAAYQAVGILNTNGSANNSILYKGPRGGLFYINSKNNISYVSSYQKEFNVKYFV